MTLLQVRCEVKDLMVKYEEELYTADARCGIEDIRGPTLGLPKDG
jgi:hypothetical protein